MQAKNDEALAQAIVELLNNGNLIEILGKNARKSAMELLSWTHFRGF
jgi:glycosyltransferase involved in cell wall biosynthesis